MSTSTEKSRKVGGSGVIAARGLKRGGGEVNPGDPARFCVVGGSNEGDASEATLRARYRGNAWAQAIITAALDKYRAGEEAPEFFWHRLRDGVNTPIRYVDLGEDVHGEVCLLIVDGRHRKDGIIRVNAERAATSEPEPYDLPALCLKLPRGEANAERAGDIVRRVKTDSNISVAMAPSHLASRAIEWHARGFDDYVVGQKIGLRRERCEQDVPRYLALAECEREVQEAVDSGTVRLEEVGRWRNVKGVLTKTPAEQREWLAARLAPPHPRVAATGPKPLRAPRVAAFVGELAKVNGAVPGEVLAFARFVGGDEKALDAYPEMRACWLRAQGTVAS